MDHGKILDRWLRREALSDAYSFVPLTQTVLKGDVQTYIVQTPTGPLFVKVCLHTSSVAMTEYKYYLCFRHLPFIPKLLYFLVSPTDQSRLLAYEVIDGVDLYRQAPPEDNLSMSTILSQALTQMHRMRMVLPAEEGVPPAESWALQSPMRQRFLPPAAGAAFLNDYAIVLARNAQAIRLFPGFFLDRNPRNVMYGREQVYQVDFGVIERSSPLFDLAKLLRNGTDMLVPAGIEMNSVRSNLHLMAALALCPGSQEQALVDMLYEQITGPAALAEQSRTLFNLFYRYACLHTHLFYLIKCGKVLRIGTGDVERLFSQCYYHCGMAFQMLDKLEQLGEPVAPLRTWVEIFLRLIGGKQALFSTSSLNTVHASALLL